MTSSPNDKSGEETNHSLSLAVVSKLLSKTHEARHRLRVRRLDQSMETCGVQVAVRIRPLNKKGLE